LKNKTDILNKASAGLFLVGALFSRLKSVPIYVLGTVLNLTSLLAYFVGYLIWYSASLFYPNVPRKDDRWFGFADTKYQYQMAALLGTVSTLIFLIAPAFFLLAAWLFTLSNVIWSIGEYHKKQNPDRNDKFYSTKKQGLYLRYAAIIAASSLLSAVSATAISLFPAATIIILASSLIIGVGLAIPACYYWLKSVFGYFRPDSVKHSYHKLSNQLSFSLTSKDKPSSVNQDTPDIHHSAPLSPKRTSNKDLDIIEKPNNLPRITCQ